MTDPRASTGAPFLGGLATGELLRRTRRKLVENELPLRASAVAYYATTALVPFLGVVIALAAQLAPDVSGAPGERGALGGMTVEEFRSTLAHVLPEEAYLVVADEIARIQKQPPVGLLSVGLAMSLWLASALFGTVIDASNRVHGAVETRPLWRTTLLALALTALQAVIVIGGLVVLVVWPKVRGWFGWVEPPGIVETAFEWLVVGLAVSFSYSVVSSLAPNVPRRWRWITPGSAMIAPAFLASALLLRVYVKYFGHYGKTYGSLAGVMVLAFWFWVAALIMLTALQVDRVVEDAREK